MINWICVQLHSASYTWLETWLRYLKTFLFLIVPSACAICTPLWHMNFNLNCTVCIYVPAYIGTYSLIICGQYKAYIYYFIITLISTAGCYYNLLIHNICLISMTYAFHIVVWFLSSSIVIVQTFGIQY